MLGAATSAHIGVYYRAYLDVMAHWSRVLPLPILDISYEDVVHDQRVKAEK